MLRSISVTRIETWWIPFKFMTRILRTAAQCFLDGIVEKARIVTLQRLLHLPGRSYDDVVRGRLDAVRVGNGAVGVGDNREGCSDGARQPAGDLRRLLDADRDDLQPFAAVAVVNLFEVRILRSAGASMVGEEVNE